MQSGTSLSLQPLVDAPGHALRSRWRPELCLVRLSRGSLVANSGLSNVLLQLMSNPLTIRLSRWHPLDKALHVTGEIMISIFGK